MKQLFTLTFFVLSTLNILALEPGDEAPDFSLSDLNNDTYTLSELRGKVVVLYFLGNNCPFCKGTAPSIESTFQGKYGSEENFIILGIDTWANSSSILPSFQGQTGVTFPLLKDGSSVSSNYNTTYDRLIVVDADGIIRYKGSSAAANNIAPAENTVVQYLQTVSVNDIQAQKINWLVNDKVLQISDYNSADQLNIQIVDLKGQVVLNENTSTNVDLNGLTKGIYLINWNVNGQAVQTDKLFIN